MKKDLLSVAIAAAATVSALAKANKFAPEGFIFSDEVSDETNSTRMSGVEEGKKYLIVGVIASKLQKAGEADKVVFTYPLAEVESGAPATISQRILHANATKEMKFGFCDSYGNLKARFNGTNKVLTILKKEDKGKDQYNRTIWDIDYTVEDAQD